MGFFILGGDWVCPDRVEWHRAVMWREPLQGPCERSLLRLPAPAQHPLRPVNLAPAQGLPVAGVVGSLKQHLLLRRIGRCPCVCAT
jgi:hypothetical protein